MPELGTLARQIADFVVTWALSAAAGAGLTVLILRTWVSEKIKGQIKSEYDEKLSTLQARLKNEYDAKLETHKAQLKARGDVEIEKLKSDLSIAAAQRQVRFSKLHERRAEVIEEIYKLLKEFLYSTVDYVWGEVKVPPEEREKKVAEAAEALSALYQAKRIFLPRSAAEKVDQVYYELRHASIHFSDNRERENEIFRRLDEVIKPAVEELETEFRTLLGDEPLKSAAAATSASSASASSAAEDR